MRSWTARKRSVRETFRKSSYANSSSQKSRLDKVSSLTILQRVVTPNRGDTRICTFSRSINRLINKLTHNWGKLKRVVKKGSIKKEWRRKLHILKSWISWIAVIAFLYVYFLQTLSTKSIDDSKFLQVFQSVLELCFRIFRVPYSPYWHEWT